MGNLTEKTEEQKRSRLKRFFDSNNMFFAVPFLAILAVLFLIGYLLLGIGITAGVVIVAGAFTQQTNWLLIVSALLFLNGLYHEQVRNKWTKYLLVYSLAARNEHARWINEEDGSIDIGLLDKYSSAVVLRFSPSIRVSSHRVWNSSRTKWYGDSTSVSTPEYLSKPREWKKIYKYEGKNDSSPSNFVMGEFFRDAGPYQVSALEARHVSACKSNRSYLWAKISVAIVAVVSMISFLINGF
jgi:hypothetical protein